MIAVEKAETAFEHARKDLVYRHIFYGSLSLQLKPAFVDWCDTGATDGEWLFMNAGWLLGLTPGQRVGFVGHEVVHCALKHPFRRGSRELSLWNEACDHVVNLILLDAKMDLPPEGLADERFRDMSAEQVYAVLEREKSDQAGGGGQQPPQPQQEPQGPPPGGGGGQGEPGGPQGDQEPQGQGGSQGQDQEPQQGQGQGDGGEGGVQHQPRPAPDPGGCGGVIDPVNPENGKPLDDSEMTDRESSWGTKAAQASQLARKRGDLPGGLERALDASAESEVDWRARLRDVMQSQVLSDFSYANPNRTMLVEYDVVMPGLKKENAPPIVIAIDASGSVTQDELDDAASEIAEIVEVLKPDSVVVLYHDTRVTGTQEFDPEDEIELKTNAGGGTDFRPVFRHIEDEGLDPVVLVFFTDTHGPFPTEEPDYPVLWVTQTPNAEERVPFGDVIEIR